MKSNRNPGDERRLASIIWISAAVYSLLKSLYKIQNVDEIYSAHLLSEAVALNDNDTIFLRNHLVVFYPF